MYMCVFVLCPFLLSFREDRMSVLSSECKIRQVVFTDSMSFRSSSLEYDHGKNILVDFFTFFHNDHRKVNIRVATRVAKRLNTQDLRKLVKFRKSLKCLELIGKYSACHQKKILTVVLQNCEKTAVKHSIEKPVLLNFGDLSTIFCSRL